jgi:hypothetical protein
MPLARKVAVTPRDEPAGSLESKFQDSALLTRSVRAALVSREGRPASEPESGDLSENESFHFLRGREKEMR